MGLLGKAIAKNNVNRAGSASTEDIHALIAHFHHEAHSFHCIVLQGSGDITGMIAGHGAVCANLPDGNLLVLLPGALDRKLFAHRLSKSSGLAVLAQFHANSSSIAIETLNPYLR